MLWKPLADPKGGCNGGGTTGVWMHVKCVSLEGREQTCLVAMIHPEPSTGPGTQRVNE